MKLQNVIRKDPPVTCNPVRSQITTPTHVNHPTPGAESFLRSY